MGANHRAGSPAPQGDGALLGSRRMLLVAPTAFKGTLTPLEAARALALPGDRLLPLSDGGDGFLECLQAAVGGETRAHPAADPFGRVRPVPYLELPDGTIAIESAKESRAIIPAE